MTAPANPDPIVIPITHSGAVTGIEITPDIARQIVAMAGADQRIETIRTSTDEMIVDLGKRIAALEAERDYLKALRHVEAEFPDQPAQLQGAIDLRTCQPDDVLVIDDNGEQRRARFGDGTIRTEHWEDHRPAPRDWSWQEPDGCRLDFHADGHAYGVDDKVIAIERAAQPQGDEAAARAPVPVLLVNGDWTIAGKPATASDASAQYWKVISGMNDEIAALRAKLAERGGK